MLALLFPGQGSQFVGMGRDVFDASSTARETFRAADDALGFPLSELCFDGPEDALQLTENQQPAILTVSIALLQALRERTEVHPDFFAGHSLGEYTALVAAGALPFEQAVQIVQARGRFMQEAVPRDHGAMAALIGCTPEVAVECCEAAASETGQVVAAANFNSPRQTVIAGEAKAVTRAGEKALERGAKRAIALPVSAPFHCSMMASAAERLAAELARANFSDVEVPVVTNVEAKANRAGARLPELLRTQVTEPVRFTDMINELTRLGVKHFLEVGPGRVLSGLIARIARRSKRASVGGTDDLEDVQAFLAEIER